jgi:superoxide dismutase, Fe-Mn family
MPIELPHLDYSFDALEPHISGATLKTHHGKHHRSYVDKTNALIAGSALSGATLDEIVRHAAQRRASEAAMAKLFNQAAQAWNHTFYWRSLRPPSTAKPQGALGDAIRGTFGGQTQFEEAFKTAATDQFASGWAWLVLDGRSLRIVTTGNAETPIAQGQQRPLLCVDVWEHAYYLDYQERRPEHLSAVIGNLLNWDFAQRLFQSA